MKLFNSILIALTISSAAVTAEAQTAQASSALSNLSYYGDIGISGTSIQETGFSNTHLPAVTVLLGARYKKYIGVEGEYSAGLTDEKLNVTSGGQTIGSINYKLDHQYAGYVVGYWPISPRTDLLARVGYGNEGVTFSGGGVSATGSGDTWNVGVGAQTFLTTHDGLRLDFTHATLTSASSSSFNTFAFSYVRRF